MVKIMNNKRAFSKILKQLKTEKNVNFATCKRTEY